MQNWLLTILILFQVHATQALDIELRHAQLLQAEFDERFFEINDGFEKTRHILLHLMKTLGKMATYCEIKEHGKIEPNISQLLNEVIPDLLIHALQLANHHNIDLAQQYLERIDYIIERSLKAQEKKT